MIRRAGFALIVLAVATAIAGPWIVPGDPIAQHLTLRLEGPSAEHWLGMDELGRDILARLVLGARVSLAVGVAVVGLSASIGIVIGALAGYLGGRVDTILGRLMDVLLAFPGILLAIALVAVMGPSLSHVVLALVTIGWVSYARLVRGQVLKVRELDYVQAARALGAPMRRVVARHVVPATFSAVTVQATLGMAGAILAEASLSFLGLGVQPPTPSWGSMLDAGRSHLFDAPHLTIVPGVAIALVVLAFNLAGDALRDRLDPRAG
jgi:peptide/nickel transport system permease protein